VSRAVLAHSTHVRGTGSYDAATATEHPRVTVTLATGIGEAETRALSLSYRDPASIDPAAWEGRDGALVVHEAGEQLYRLGSASMTRLSMARSSHLAGDRHEHQEGVSE
jgi:hypothetical protein